MIPVFSDLIKEKNLSGDKKKIEDLLDKSIIVTNYQVSPSKYKTEHCVKIQFYFEDDETQTRYIVFTGSEVLKNQLEQIEHKLNEDNLEFLFKAKITKIGKYYSFE